jgi:hypothetical protein
VKKEVNEVVQKVRSSFSPSSAGGDGAAEEGETLDQTKVDLKHTVSDTDKDNLADHNGFRDFETWKKEWNGEGRGPKSAGDWRKIKLRALQSQTFNALSVPGPTGANLGGTDSSEHECFDIVALLLDASAIKATLKSPKTFTLAVGELRSGAEALVICDEVANLPISAKFTNDDNRKEWLYRIGELKHLMKQNALLKQVRYYVMRCCKPCPKRSLLSPLKLSDLCIHPSSQDKTISCSTVAFYLSTLAFIVGAFPNKLEGKKAQQALLQTLSGLVSK